MVKGYTSWESGFEIKPHAKGLFTILINLQFTIFSGNVLFISVS